MENKPDEENGRKLFLIEGVISSSTTRAFTGDLLTAYALALGSNERQIGMLSTARHFASFAQLLTSYFLEKTGSKRLLFYYVFGITNTIRLLVPVLSVIPFIFVHQNIVWCLIALMFLISSGESIILVLKKAWMSEITPVDIRGRYFGLRGLIGDSSGMIIGYLSGLYVDRWKQANGEMFGFQSFLLVSAIAGYLAFVIVSRIPEISDNKGRQSLKDFLGSFREPFRDKTFSIWILFNASYSFAVGFAGPFFTVYLLRELGLPLATVAIYTAIGEIPSIGLSRFWGSLADRYGNMIVLVISTIAKSIFPALWIFTSGNNSFWAITWLVFVHSIRGFNSAQGITMLNILLEISPQKSRPMYLAYESTIVNLVAAISPFIGGILLELISERHTDISFLCLQLKPMHLLFLISALLRSISSLALIWVSTGKTNIMEKDVDHN